MSKASASQPSDLAEAAPDRRAAFVTGATGFVGQRLVRMLDEAGWSVVCGVRPGSEGRRPAGRHVRVVACDLLGSIGPAIPRGVDTVFHLAGKAHALAEVRQDESEYAELNTGGTRLMLEAAQSAGARAFVYFSSVKAVADAPSAVQPVDESWDAEPDTPYGRSKREAERLVLGGRHVPHPVVLRPCLVYGPQPKGNLEKLLTAVRRHRFPPLPELGNKRSMVHVDDVCRAALLAATHAAAGGRTYIVADDRPFSTRELFLWACEGLGRPVPVWTVPITALRLLAWVGDFLGRARGRRFFFDSEALTRLTDSAWYSPAAIEELGWRPRHTLRDALPAMVADDPAAAARAPTVQG